jgi:CBS domain-containing protein
MNTVKKLLEAKGQNVWSISPEASVFEAIKLMAEKRIGALLAMEDDHLVGIMSERDYARKVVLKGKSSKKTPVKDIMTSRVYFVKPERTIEECMALMTDKRIRHLPVMDEERLVGVISIGDVVKAIISEQEFIIDQLESYIKGR